MRIRKAANNLVIVAVAIVTVGLVMGCASSPDGSDSSSSGSVPLSTPASSVINGQAVADDVGSPDVDSAHVTESSAKSGSTTSPGSIFTTADMEAVGWKKSRQLDIGDLEGAKEIWYGFFDQKDIELWIYASFDDAVNLGARAAQSILDENRVVDVLNSIRGGTRVYSYYLVVGNMLMFCESASSCDVLAERVS